MNIFKKILILALGLGLVSAPSTLNKVEEVNAADVPTTLYLTPNANWSTGGARFAAYFFGNGETWSSMSTVEGETNLYSVSVPSGYQSVIFCRMNPATTENNWSNKWNQTVDLSIPTDGTNCYTVTEGTWDKGGGKWSTYESKLPSYTVTFDTNDVNQEISSLIVEKGTVISEPVLKISGYPLEGWYTESTFENKFNFGTPITSNLNLFAKWGDYNGIADRTVSRVYFEAPESWSTVNIHIWGNGSVTDWPGVPMNKVGESNLYYYDGNMEYCLFNNGNKEQTTDIPLFNTNGTIFKTTDSYDDNGTKKYNWDFSNDESITPYFQTASNDTDTSLNIRFLATLGSKDAEAIDLANYNKVGFVVLGDVNGELKTTTKTTTKVYTKINVLNKVLHADAFDSQYIFAITVDNVPLGQEFFVLPFAEDVNGNVTYGVAKTFAINK